MISIGTCSWTEKTLIQSGEFYSGEVKTAEGRLRYYADQFDTVEVDATYYAIPDRKNTSLWAERTPEDFIFHIKAYGAFTGHGIDPKTLPKDMHALLPEKDKSAKYVYTKEPSLLGLMAERFRDSLTPLIQAKKLGVLVFQFPPWFQYRKTNFDSILKCRELMQGLPIAVEFRHGSWLTPDVQQSVFQFLEDSGLTYIAADEPQYGSLATVPFIPRTTSDTAYFRFHGRNKETWLKKGVETALRYSYLYSDQELREFVPPLHSAGKKAKITYAMFNNCHGGFAMRNALRLKELTGQKTQ
ncbi:MAG: DUF72 domain-containing protein [Thermodesulfovibrionales bacterium]|nr:DUF72 domain-containing protein [Thermodesulfovibrionales bacterium]